MKTPTLTRPQAQEPREAPGHRWVSDSHLHLCQDRMMPGLLSRQNAPQMALVGSSRIRQAERHANVVVRWTLTMPHT